MLGSIDCMHYEWGKFPVAWRGQFTRGDHSYPTIMLEDVASYDNWIWHAYFGVAEANNDLNVLHATPLFNSMLIDELPDIPYILTVSRGILVQLIKKRTYFSKKQASARQDVERTFGILQGPWHILQQPARTYKIKAIQRIMHCCIILHNMIVEDNGYNIAENLKVYEQAVNMQTSWIDRCDPYKRRTKELRDIEVHDGLRFDLAEHH
ncbi:uncharacterized protein [Rutidosis leptorrhynchoides]|uniref:uncharacterized protein n=1 Tax=Rutidosis leptorrhynchoides TaxID=125765 RepID=UPI003A9932F1